MTENSVGQFIDTLTGDYTEMHKRCFSERNCGTMNILDLPFNQHVGLGLTRYGETKVVCLEPESLHCNHLGTIHASAVYSLAEAASGHECLNRIGLNPSETTAVLRSAKVKYRRPANDRLLGLAVIDDGSIRLFNQQFAEKGRSFIDVHVRVIAGDGEEEVFAGDFSWFVSRSN